MRAWSTLAATAALVWAGQGSAQVDPRVQTQPYMIGAVTPVRVPVGYVATIILGDDERIESIAVGNTAAWEVTPNKSGDHLFVKPLTTGVATNVEVVTDSRHYSFLLQSTFDGDPQAVFQLRFDYPVPVGRTMAVSVERPSPARPGDPGVAIASAEATLGRYQLNGSRQARPLAMDDDGTHTYLRFADAASLPAIYAVDEQGHEMLVTARQSDDALVVDRIWQRYVFRIGKATARARRVVDRPGKRRIEDDRP